MMPYQTILYETTESEYESSENGSVEIPAQSTSPNKTSKRKPVQWKLKNLFIDPNLIQFKMNDEQKQHVETINNLDTELSFFYHLFPKDLISDIVYQTTLYSVETRPDWPVKVTENNVERFMVCLL